MFVKNLWKIKIIYLEFTDGSKLDEYWFLGVRNVAYSFIDLNVLIAY